MFHATTEGPMRLRFKMLVAMFVLLPIGNAYCASPALKINAFADIFNEAAKSNHLDKVAKLEMCKNRIIISWCRYRISDHTMVVVSGRKKDAMARGLTIITTAHEAPLSSPIAAEHSAIWSTVIQMLNPEVALERRSEMLNRFTASIKKDQAGFATKVGTNRYSVFADPSIGIWLIANWRPSTSVSEAGRSARLENNLEQWTKGGHEASEVWDKAVEQSAEMTQLRADCREQAQKQDLHLVKRWRFIRECTTALGSGLK